MVDTIKISALPVEIAPTSDDYVAMVDNATSTTKKVAFDEFGKAINYSNSLSTDANNLLAVDGSNKLNLTASNELISIDANNTITVGSDGKLKGSATSLSLNENELFVGNASNQPVSTSANDVRQVLGLPTDYIKDDIQYISANQVSWDGSCRDSSDSRDFKIVGATTASLVGATANTTYNLFVASNTLIDAPVIVWDIGSTPAGYTFYRRVLSIVTDGIGNIIPFTSFTEKSGDLRLIYDDFIIDRSGAIAVNVVENVVLSSIPDNLYITPMMSIFLVGSNANTSSATIGSANKEGQVFAGAVVSSAFFSSILISSLSITSATVSIKATGAGLDDYSIRTYGYIDGRV